MPALRWMCPPRYKISGIQVVYGTELFRDPTPLMGWSTEYSYWIKPRGETYQGPVALLIDTVAISTTENFTAAMKDRAYLIGRKKELL